MTREEAIERIRYHMIVHKINEPRAIYITKALEMAIEALEQESILDKVKLLDNENMLDKIRTEINGLMHNKDNASYVCGVLDCLDIIDEYTGSEE